MEYAALGPIAGIAFVVVAADAAGRRKLDSIWVLVLCVVAILSVTLVPVPGPSDVQLRLGEASPSNDIANVILFAPLGVVLYLRRWAAARSVLTALLLSAGIEIAQRAIPGRTTSLDDVVFNTLGAGVGWLLASLLWSRFRG